MKLADFRRGDWQRYFDKGWMLYGRTPVMVRIPNRGSVTIQRGSTLEPETLEDTTRLTSYYPEGMCINTYDVGICVDRRARQQARRTASTTNYEVIWCPPTKRLSLDTRIMFDLARFDRRRTYPSLEVATRKLNTGFLSIAVSPDLILSRSRDNQFDVVWHSFPAGTLNNGMYEPDRESSCFTKLVRQTLQEIGPECL